MPALLPFRQALCVVLLAVMTLTGCEPPPAVVLDQQVYIWQRQWRPTHAQALVQTRSDFSTLRVLAAQMHPQEGWIQARIDPQMLKQDGRPLIAVIRLDGQLPRLDSNAITEQMHLLIRTWRTLGLNLQGVEIDHDCASNGLEAYAAMLHDLRSQLPNNLALSITALPAWLDSPTLPAVLAEVDSSVLQVHAVNRPALGLFEPNQALRWAKAYGAITTTPFLLALPAYGVALSESGEVESEAPLIQGGKRRELQADSQQLAMLIERLHESPVTSLTGLIWFRLPLADDRRAWPLTTLQAVVHQQPLRSDLQVEVQQQGSLYEIRVVNRGNLSAPLPSEVRGSGKGCEAADGVQGFRVEQSFDSLHFKRPQSSPQSRHLLSGQSRAVGWARCQQLDQGGFSVTP